MSQTLSPPASTTGPRPLRAPRGPQRSCKGWIQEAALRMLLNNLDPEVAEDPDRLVVYGGSGKAARTWKDLAAIVSTLRKLENDETLLVQSGKPVGVFRTQPLAPRVLIANSLLVPRWATWEEFRRLEAMGLTMFGQMTAGSPAGAAIDHEAIGVLGHLGIEVVHEHAQGGLLHPALAGALAAARGAEAPGSELAHHSLTHTLKMRCTFSRSTCRASATAPASVVTPGRTKSSARIFARMRRYMLNFGRPNSSLYMSL